MDKSIKVLQILNGKAWSGIESHLLLLAGGFQKYHSSGMPPVQMIMAPLNPGDFIDVSRHSGFAVRPIYRRFKGDPLVFYKIHRIIKQDGIDIVHTHAHNGNFYGRFGAIMSHGVKVVSTIHDFPEAHTYIYKKPMVSRIINSGERLGASMSHKLIAVSKYLKDRLIDDGLPDNKIISIPNGIDVERYDTTQYDLAGSKQGLGLDDDELVVGTAGRLHSRKNVQLLLRAGRALLDQGIKVRLLIIGDGPLKPALEKLASDLGITENVLFTGWRSDPNPFVAMMDVFVMCSHADTTPMVLLEALALKRPVVCTAVGGIPEIIEDGKQGVLIRDDDLSGLTDSLRFLLHHPETAQKLGYAGRELIEERYCDEVMVKETRKVYMELLQ